MVNIMSLCIEGILNIIMRLNLLDASLLRDLQQIPSYFGVSYTSVAWGYPTYGTSSLLANSPGTAHHWRLAAHQ